MEITGKYNIPAARQDVWTALNDPEVLKVCVPGCEELSKISETQFEARVVAKIGAVRAKLKGMVELSDIDAPNSYVIAGTGQGGVAGFAKGSAKVMLSDAPGGGTLLTYNADAALGGKLAAVGSRVIQGVAKKMADDFFGKFARVLSGEVIAAAPSEKMERVPEGMVLPSQRAGTPDWVKGAIVNAIISAIAVFVAVALVSG